MKRYRDRYPTLEEFVTRDGTDHSSVERRIEKVLLQLDAGRVELRFDGETRTCNIRPVEENPSAGRRDNIVASADRSRECAKIGLFMAQIGLSD